MKLSARLVRVSQLALVVVSAFALTGFGCRQDLGTKENINTTLQVWGLWQESSHMEPVIRAFTEATGIQVEYKKIASIATYEKDLLQALAAGRGPDVFVIHHTWVDGRRDLLSPAPSSVVDQRAVNEEFVEVVGQDVIRDGQILALPTSVDTMALYYNRDLLNAAGIARPPSTWNELQTITERLTQVNRVGTIQQSAAALGAAANVNRAPDIIQLLLLQSGLSIYNPEQNQVDIANEVGERALVFYTDFSNKSKKVYTWNLQQDYSIDAFAEGSTAMMFNYSYHLPTIRAKNPRLNFAVAPMPQIADSKIVNFAAYWPFAVSNTSTAPTAAWQFVRFITSNEQAAIINQAQGVPPARKDGVLQLARDPNLGVFAEQALTARTWPRLDITATDTIFNTMIDNVVTGSAGVPEALRRAQDQLNRR